MDCMFDLSTNDYIHESKKHYKIRKVRGGNYCSFDDFPIRNHCYVNLYGNRKQQTSSNRSNFRLTWNKYIDDMNYIKAKQIKLKNIYASRTKSNAIMFKQY